MEKSDIKKVIESYKLSVKFEFIPFSKSRNKSEKYKSLNYQATVYYKDREIFVTDYGLGEAFCPSYRPSHKTIDMQKAIDYEIEHGYDYMLRTNKIVPCVVGFFYSISNDAEALNHSGFEDWASCLGYDSDSRSGERIYNACLKIAIALRNAIGDIGLKELQEIYEDY
jgi:hypothetical protein